MTTHPLGPEFDIREGDTVRVTPPRSMADRFPDDGHEPWCMRGTRSVDAPPKCDCGVWGRALREMPR